MNKAYVHTALLATLREVFVQGEIEPGSKVCEAVLCARFGVSRTPLREALKVLAAEGHVELLPNRGARVPIMTTEEVEGLFAVAGALEALAGEQAAQRIDAAEYEQIASQHAAMRDAFDARDRARYYEANRRIHEALISATHNPVLMTQYAMVNARIQRIRFSSPMSEDIWQRAMAEHEGMLNALARRDAAALAGILRTHLKHKCEAILVSLRARPSAPPVNRRKRRPVDPARLDMRGES